MVDEESKTKRGRRRLEGMGEKKRPERKRNWCKSLEWKMTLRKVEK